MTTTKHHWPELLLGLGIMCVGLVLGYEAATIKVGPLYAKVGPSVFLWLVAGLLVVCGAIVTYRSRSLADATRTSELRGPIFIMAALGLSVILMDVAGFVPTAVMIFTLTAKGLGSNKWLRDLLIGLTLSGAAFAVFTMGLGLRLPVGVLFQ